MKTPPPIVVAIDFSKSTPHLIAHAAKLATAVGSRLIAVHVIQEGLLSDWMHLTGRKVSIADRATEVKQLLQELLDQCPAEVETEIEVRVGRPYKMIGQIVAEKHADLLVLGAHNLPNRPLGPVACRCARNAPSSVLILRDWQGNFFDKIAVCVNLRAPSDIGLGRAIELAAIHQATLEIIHVIYPPNLDPWGKALEQPADKHMSYETMVRTRARKRLDAFLKPFARRLAAIEWSTVVLESESPAAVIAAHLDAGEIDLTVIGSKDSSWVGDFVLGNTTERLLHDSKASILITRETRVPQSHEIQDSNAPPLS